MSFNSQLRKRAEEAFSERRGKENFVEYEFKDYKGQHNQCLHTGKLSNLMVNFTGTAHGFACRPNLGLQEVKEAYEKALEQTITWFQKTLPA